MRNTKKAIGQRGSWFASVEDEELPCVHAHWFKAGYYHDTDAHPDIERFRELFDAIKEKRKVILTRDDLIMSGGEHTGFARAGYIAIFSVDEPVLDERGLRFKFLKRLFNLD